MMNAGTPAPSMKRWKDNRTTAKQKAAADLEVKRRQMLWAQAHRSRQHALETAAPRYVGRQCRRCSSNERYTNHGPSALPAPEPS